MNAASDAAFVDRDSGALPIAGAGRVKLHGPAPLYWINRMLARRLFQVVVTTLISGSPFDEVAKIFRDLVPAPPHHPGCPAGAMRRHDDIRQFVKRMTRAAPVGLGGIRILPPDIDRGAADCAIAQGSVERILVDDCAARDVDEECRRFHPREAAGVEQPLGFGPEGGADRDSVAERQHLVECRQRIDALDAVAGLARATVRGKDMAAESGGTARHLSPDPTEPDDPQCRAADLAMRRAALDPARRPCRV